MADLLKTLSSNSDKLVFEKNRILEDEKLERIENDRKITELERLLEGERIKRVEMEDLSKKSKKLTVTSEPIFLEKMKNSLWILIVSIFLILVILAWAKPGTEVDFFGWFKVKQGTDQNKGSSDIKMEATNHIVSVIGGIKINGNNKSPIKIGGIKISNLTSVPSVPLLASNKFLFEEVDISNKQFLTIEIDFANGTFVLSEPLPLPDKATKVIDVKGLLFEVTEKKDDKARPIVIYKQQYNQINGNSGDIRQ